MDTAFYQNYRPQLRLFVIVSRFDTYTYIHAKLKPKTVLRDTQRHLITSVEFASRDDNGPVWTLQGSYAYLGYVNRLPAVGRSSYGRSNTGTSTRK